MEQAHRDFQFCAEIADSDGLNPAIGGEIKDSSLKGNDLTMLRVKMSILSQIGSIKLNFGLVDYIRQLKHLLHQYKFDGLTGLYGREAFNHDVGKDLQSGKIPTDGGHKLIVIDLDKFKPINDNCGHAEGNRILKEAANAFVESLGNSAIVARWGGDEFVAMVPWDNSDEELRELISHSLNDIKAQDKNGTVYKAGASTGVAPITNECLEEAFVAADADLYVHKRARHAELETAQIGTGSFDIPQNPSVS